ncbi:hypothetical protein JK358_37160 [Nocardia sp. 2]|uniref:YbaB/EbfC DNA-binding family protein n=1 Tax=Nocardia acididurans TaxID=2802282 RepID=A0ABS1MH99_9NOCA|nr:hypothetical protein [Nocardia acididurans]MBL1080041.1 hypothetical protein [Nocardia acididurans]
MTEFDRLYHRVKEMNQAWHELLGEIRSGRHTARRAEERRRVSIVDEYAGTEYGYVVVDGNGTLHAIELEPYEVAQSNEFSVLNAVRAAINSAQARPRPQRRHSEVFHG